MFLTEPTAQVALRPSSSRERRNALTMALVISAALGSWAAFGVGALPYSAQFFAAYVTALTLAMLFGAIVSGFRARLVGDRASVLVAAAFVFSLPVLVVYAMTFPDVAPRALWRPHDAAWFSLMWKLGWAGILGAYAWQPRRGDGRPGRSLLIAFAASVLVDAVILSGVLPVLRPEPGVFRPASYVADALLVGVIVAVLAGLLRRRMTTLDTWLAAGLVILLTGAVLLCFSTSRISTIADAARMANLFAMITVACAVVYEFQRLLARSSSLERFMTMAQYAPTIVYLLDAQGECTYVNPRWVAITGQPLEEALGRGWASVVHPDDLAARGKEIDADLAAGTAHSVEFRYRCADGAYRWFLATATPTYDEQGQIDGWYGAATDIDSQHRALDEARRLEREAAERENDIRRIAETIPGMAWTATPDGNIRWLNRRWYDYTGQSRSDDPNDSPSFFHPDDVTEAMRRWNESLRTGTPFEFENRIRAADGSYRWFLSRAKPTIDDRGAVITWYGTSTDIDEQRRQAGQLAALYAREHALANRLQTAFIPPFLPHVDGLAFQAVYRPALRELELGGDWYDVFVMRDGRVAISIGDIAGHGIDAAIAMVRVRETIRAVTAFLDTDPGSILEMADRAFIATHPEALATAAFAFYDPATRRLTCARAGHPAPALVRDGVATLVSSEPGSPLGIDLESRFVSTSYELQPGDTIVFYTDGLLEIDRDLIAGERRFLELLGRGGVDVNALVDEMLAGRQRDDVALVQFTVLESDVTSWHFESDDAGSADDSRYAFANHLRRRVADAAVVSAAELVFGELIGNVVRHAPGPIEIELAWRAGTPLLIVRDRGPQFTIDDVALPDDPLAEGGRGLFLVERFASAPIVVPRFGGGNEVVVALPVPAGSDDLAVALT